MMEKTSFPILVSQDSDVGRSEKRFYEDRLRVENIVTKSGLRITLAVVSDGIGGENAGERAAQKTVDTIFSFCSESTSTDILQILEAAIIHANKEVFAESGCCEPIETWVPRLLCCNWIAPLCRKCGR